MLATAFVLFAEVGASETVTMPSWLLTLIVSIMMSALGAGIGFAAAFATLKNTVQNLNGLLANIQAEVSGLKETVHKMDKQIAVIEATKTAA